MKEEVGNSASRAVGFYNCCLERQSLQCLQRRKQRARPLLLDRFTMSIIVHGTLNTQLAEQLQHIHDENANLFFVVFFCSRPIVACSVASQCCSVPLWLVLYQGRRQIQLGVTLYRRFRIEFDRILLFYYCFRHL